METAQAAARLLSRSDESLPWEDEAVEQLDAARREHVGEYWRGRASAELRVSAAFADLRDKLAMCGATTDVLVLLEASIGNELHHAAMCTKLAARYLGGPLPPPPPVSIRLPPLPHLDPASRAMVYAAGMCAINESVATVWLEHCLSRSEAPLARAVSQVHLSDEVVHARVGWAHLSSEHVTPAMRRLLAGLLQPLLQANVSQWLRSTALRGPSVPAHGIPDVAEQRDQILGAIRSVVLPGFDYVGVDISSAMAWFRSEFPG